MTSTNPNYAARWMIPSAGLARLRNAIGWSSEERLAHRLAGAAFLIEVLSAALAYVVQVLLARWMGSFEFGVYAYMWTWVMLLGSVVDCGMAASAARFIPEYTDEALLPLQRGFLHGSALLVLATSTGIAAAGALGIWLVEASLAPYTVIAAYLAMLALPLFSIGRVQEYVARCYDWVALSLAPTYILRQFALLVFMGLGYFIGAAMTANTAMVASILAILVTIVGQRVMLSERLAKRIGRGPKRYAIRTWLATSLPLLVVDSFYFLLSYVDVILLQQFASPETVAVYYSATKTMAIVTFVHFAVAATNGHKLAAAGLAENHALLNDLAHRAVRLTFWPSLAATALLLAIGRPLLGLFGAGFSDGYDLLMLLSIGLLARASIGPAERLLNMVGCQNRCAVAYAAALTANVVLCLILIPRFGAAGAGMATSAALIVELALLFLSVKRLLGIHMFALE